FVRSVAVNRIAIKRILNGEDDARGGAAAGDFFNDYSVGNVVEAGPAFGFGESDAGETQFRGLGEKISREMAGLVVFTSARFYFRLGKFANAFLEEFLFFGQFEVQERLTWIARYFNARTVSHLRCSLLLVDHTQALTGWANVWHASGAGFRQF